MEPLSLRRSPEDPLEDPAQDRQRPDLAVLPIFEIAGEDRDVVPLPVDQQALPAPAALEEIISEMIVRSETTREVGVNSSPNRATSRTL